MVSVYALLCATLLHSECTTATAIDVIRMPDAENELACLRDSMTTLAGLAIQPGNSEYWKVICAEQRLAERCWVGAARSVARVADAATHFRKPAAHRPGRSQLTTAQPNHSEPLL